MKRTRQLLNENTGNPEEINAVIISHLHGDHISYYPLRVIEDCNYTIKIHKNSIQQLKQKHFNGYGFNSLKLEPFSKEFKIGNLTIEPFQVPHHPGFPTYGFVIKHKKTKAVIVTDFHDGREIVKHLVDADFIFIESNHDLDLLGQYFNPNSLFHMSNPKTAQLLCLARKKSRKPPQAVMLGHISSQRNEPGIALKETMNTFDENGVDLDFKLSYAPLRESSEVVEVG